MKETAQKLFEAANLIESYRRAVNQAFSQAPEVIDFDFSASLDQLSDHQFKIALCWKKLMIDDNAQAAEVDAARTIEEAERVALLACRKLAEIRDTEATRMLSALKSVQADVTDVLDFKNKCDADFKSAITLHERNDSGALKALQKAEENYTEFISRANTKVVGTRAITKRERARQRLVLLSCLSGLVALLITLIGRENLFEFFNWFLHFIHVR